MDRLTFEGNFCDICYCLVDKCPGTCSQKEVWERLKAYEDTGLTPEEITELSCEPGECLIRQTCEKFDHESLIDPESLRPKGRWIGERCNHKPHRIKNPEKWAIYKCSICGYSNGRKQSNYCPNCGARMEG